MNLAFVGDIALGDHPKTVGFGFRSRYPEGIPATLAGRITPPGPAPDLMLGNLEFVLEDTATADALAQRQCRGGGRDYAEFLANAGVTALNVANNHSFQHGPDAFHATVATLLAAGIHVVGTPADFSEAGILEIAGRRVAMLGWSDRPRQYSTDTPPYNELSEQACARIAEAARRADVVIASIHWGDEFILVPSDRERVIARAMIDAGASAVIGHHPHVVRELEHYGNGIIAYSLGNFIGDMLWDSRTRYTAWLTADHDGNRIASAELRPGVIADDYFPRPLAQREKRQLPRRLAAAASAQSRDAALSSYAAVAAAAHRRHVRRTAWMMVRNLLRYPRGFALELFGGAISHRIRRAVSDRSLGPATQY